MRCRAAVLLFVAACGFPRPADVPGDGGGGDGDVEIPAAPTCADLSGSRIKLTVREASDGTKQVIGLYDSMRNEPCKWTQGGDGQLRCMPAPTTEGNYSDGHVAYSTATCTTPILGIFGNGYYPGKPFLGRDGADVFGSMMRENCEGRIRIFGVGSQLPDPTTVWVHDANGGCMALAADNFFFDYYAAGPELLSTNFAAGSMARDGTGRVWLESIMGPDGSHTCGGDFDLHDSQFDDAPCNPANYAYDEKRRCVPSGSATEGLFTDSGCTASKQATRRANCRPRSAFASSLVKTPVCGYLSSRVRAAGAATTALFRKEAMGVCQAVSSTYTTYSVDGDFLPEETFPEVTYVFAPTGSRLMRRDLVTGGARLETDDFYDMQLDTACRFEAGADRVTRCVPADVRDARVAEASYQVFPTADCTGTAGNYAIAFAQTLELCTEFKTPRYARIRDSGTGYSVYARLGNMVTGTFSYKSSASSSCSVLDAGSQVFQVGANVMSELVTATEARR
jgi:hypothetical protein